MTLKTREHLLAYLQSIAIAAAIAICFLPVFAGIPIPSRVILVAGSALVFGTCFFTLGAIAGRIRLKRFVLNVLVHTLLMTLTVCFASLVMTWFIIRFEFGKSPFDREVWPRLVEQMPFTAILLLAGTVLAGIINGVNQISRKLGPGVLWNWITGKYYTPREEERIFMFLDMRDSTSIAERIGNIGFSALVRDFFSDLTEPVLETKGEVSHYVGDEAVITWKPVNGLKNANCIAMFFRFQEAVNARSDYYRSRYGLVPEFKAGLHIGPVVATEVGQVKSEIVFHGDVLNTAARIQSLCNEKCCPLLVSGELACRLALPEQYQNQRLGPHHLKGKEHLTEIYSICAAASF